MKAIITFFAFVLRRCWCSSLKNISNLKHRTNNRFW